MTFNHQKTKELLKKVKELKIQSEQIARLKGEKFNFFILFNFESLEVKLHSKFIAELLDPDGSHGMGRIFLDNFLLHLQEYNILDLVEYEEANVIKELNTGRITYDYTDGGNIDIYIGTENFVIAIENKIYAGLGHKQLERYKQYLNYEPVQNKILLLLTLFPSTNVDDGLKINKDYFNITYERLILDWLEYCHHSVSDFPTIRESIKQYIILIKSLTNKLTDHVMDDKLKDLIRDYYEESKLIASKLGEVNQHSIDVLYNEVDKILKKEYSESDWEYSGITSNLLTQQWGSFFLRKKNWSEAIHIKYEGTNYLNVGFGHGLFVDIKEISGDSRLDMIKYFQGKINFRSTRGEYNSWVNFSRRKYSKLSKFLKGDKNLKSLANEISNYITLVAKQQEKNADLINNYLMNN